MLSANSKNMSKDINKMHSHLGSIAISVPSDIVIRFVSVYLVCPECCFALVIRVRTLVRGPHCNIMSSHSVVVSAVNLAKAVNYVAAQLRIARTLCKKT